MKINFAIINKASEQELRQIVVVAKELYPGYSIGICRKWIREILKNKGQSLYVAKLEGKIVGMVTLSCYPTIGGFTKAWLEDVAVTAEFQGKGIGRGLLEYAINQTKNMKIKYLNLTSRPARKAANHLYKKLGFELVKTNVYRLSLST